MGPTSRPGGLGRPLLQRLGVREAAVGLTVPDPLPVIGYDENAASSGTSATSPSSVRKVESSSCVPANGARNSHHVTTLSAPYAAPAGNTPLAKAISLGSLRKRSQDPDPFNPRRAGQLPVEGGERQAALRRPPGKSDQQKSPISQVLEPITHRPENDKEVLTEEGLGLMLSRSVSAADAAHRRPDQRTDCRV